MIMWETGLDWKSDVITSEAVADYWDPVKIREQLLVVTAATQNIVRSDARGTLWELFKGQIYPTSFLLNIPRQVFDIWKKSFK